VADSVQGGWKGILYANLAIIDPVTSYNFFVNENLVARSWMEEQAGRGIWLMPRAWVEFERDSAYICL